VALEAIAGAGLIRVWLPNEPTWVISLTLLGLLTLTNLFSVRSYGEFEFWFASIKVGAIVVFLSWPAHLSSPVAGRCSERCQPYRARRLRAERILPS